MILIDLAHETGLNPKWVAGTHGGEYHCACPKCGGKDRFRIQPNKKQKNTIGYYCCRQCKISGDTIQFCRDFLGLTYDEAVIRSGGTTQEKKRSLASLAPKPQGFCPTKSKTPINEIWLQEATTFIEKSCNQLLLQSEQLAMLDLRRIPYHAAIKYKLGWNFEEQYVHNHVWGSDKKIWLPKGLVIPLMREGKVTGIKIRRQDFKEGDKIGKYIVIPGGSDGFSIYGETKNRSNIAIVESELDAITLQHAASDMCCTIAIGGNNKNPDLIIDYLAKKAKYLLIIHDNDAGGMAMLAKWQSIYPHACPYPVPFGKDIGEAVQQGLQLREWLLAAINPITIVPAASIEPIDCATPVVVHTPIFPLSGSSVEASVEVVEQKHKLPVQYVAPSPTIPIASQDSTKQVNATSKIIFTETLMDDQVLFSEALKYFQDIPEQSKLPSDKNFLDELALGSNSARAQSGELQQDLRLVLKIAHSVKYGLSLV